MININEVIAAMYFVGFVCYFMGIITCIVCVKIVDNMVDRITEKK